MSALVAKAAQTTAVAADIRQATPNKRGVRIKRGSASYRPVATTLTICFALGFLKRWLVDKEPLPERTFWINMALLGFVLSLMAEVSPRLAKSMSYLILVSVIFAQSVPILEELDIQGGNKWGLIPTKSKPPANPGPVSPLPGTRTRA